MREEILLRWLLNYIRPRHGSNVEPYARNLRKHGLKVHYRAFGLTRKTSWVYIDDFWKWADTHRYMIDFANFDKGDIPHEPEWVAEQRELDLDDTKKTIAFSKWTTSQDKKLEKMMDGTHTWREIIDEMNRTQGSIYDRCYRLGIPINVLNVTKKRKSDEWDTISALLFVGKNVSEIAKHIDTNEQNVRVAIAKRFGTSDVTKARNKLIEEAKA